MRKRWASHGRDEMRNAHKESVKKLEKKKPLGRHGNMALCVAQDRVRCRAVVNKIINLRVS
jgi:hypothetical protein